MNFKCWISKILPNLLALATVFICQNSMAAQTALVTAERAVIFSDLSMSSPIGYVSRGKKIKIGEIGRNHGQLYPIIVSGKMAFIRAKDISTEMEYGSDNLVSERFQKAAKKTEVRTYLGLSYVHYASAISVDQSNGDIQDKDSLNWSGLGLKARGMINPSWDFEVLGHYLTTSKGEESYKIFELGIGVGYKVFDWKKLAIRLEGHALLAPYAQYAVGSLFRTNGSGRTLGANVDVSYQLSAHWGANAFAGLYQTALSGFGAPDPYVTPTPSFIGTRMGLGAYYAF